jgi:hypothetical protein
LDHITRSESVSEGTMAPPGADIWEPAERRSQVLHATGGCLHALRWAHPSGQRWKAQAQLERQKGSDKSLNQTAASLAAADAAHDLGDAPGDKYSAHGSSGRLRGGGGSGVGSGVMLRRGGGGSSTQFSSTSSGLHSAAAFYSQNSIVGGGHADSDSDAQVGRAQTVASRKTETSERLQAARRGRGEGGEGGGGGVWRNALRCARDEVR